MYYLVDDQRRRQLRVDFIRHYGVDLYDYLGGEEVDLGLISEMLFNLPKESAIVVDGGLSQQEHFFCDIIDGLNRLETLLWIVASSKTKKGSKIKMPKPMKRPQSELDKQREKELREEEFARGKNFLKQFNNQRKTEKFLARQKRKEGREDA